MSEKCADSTVFVFQSVDSCLDIILFTTSQPTSIPHILCDRGVAYKTICITIKPVAEDSA